MTLGSEEINDNYKEVLRYTEMVERITYEDVKRIITTYYQYSYMKIFSSGSKPLNEKAILSQIALYTTIKQRNASKEDYFETTLPNGTTLILKQVLGKPAIGISLSLPVSQLNESINLLGINAVTSALFIHGCENKDHNQIIQFCTNNGVQLAVSPYKEYTNFKAKCFPEMLPSTMELIFDILYKPTFQESHLHNIKNTYISTLKRMKEYPQQLAVYYWKKMFFGNNSNLIQREGTLKTLSSLSKKKVLNWYAQMYQQTHPTLALVGDIDFDNVIYLVERLSQQSITNITPAMDIRFNPTQQRYKVVNYEDSDQSILCIGGYAPKALDIEDKTAFFVLSQIIGGDVNSRLFNELREERGCAYMVDFDYQATQNLGYFLIYAIVDREQEQNALQATFSVLSDIKNNGITDYELQSVKNYIRGLRIIDEESVLSQAQTLSSLRALNYDYDYFLHREERLEAVTTKQIQELAQNYFIESNYYTHILF